MYKFRSILHANVCSYNAVKLYMYIYSLQSNLYTIAICAFNILSAAHFEGLIFVFCSFDPQLHLLCLPSSQHLLKPLTPTMLVQVHKSLVAIKCYC